MKDENVLGRVVTETGKGEGLSRENNAYKGTEVLTPHWEMMFQTFIYNRVCGQIWRF